MVRELLAAHLRGGTGATRHGHPQPVLATAVRPPLDRRANDGAPGRSLTIGQEKAPPQGDGPRRRQRLYGRLAAVFLAGSGLLGLVTLPLPAPGSTTIAIAGVDTAALVLGVASWLVPWENWPRWASLGMVPPAFALIALGNAFGGADLHTYGVFFVVVFVWIGVAHPPRTSAALALLAA